MEIQSKKVTIAGLKEGSNKEKKKTFATLIVTEYDMLNDEDETLEINLATKDSDEETYPKDKVKKAFAVLSKQTEKELVVPEETTFKNISKSLKPIKDEEINIYPFENNGYEGFSLYKGSNSSTNFYEKAEPFNEFMTKQNLVVGSNFVAPFRGFYIDTHFNAYDHVNKKSKPVNFLATTREELYNRFVNILEKDSGETAKKILKRLEEYKEKNGDKMSTAGIIQRVGVFSDESRNKGDLDFGTITSLKSVIELQKSSHAKISTIRAMFSENIQDGKKYRTSELKPNTYFSNVPKNWTLFMMMDDTILLDFKAFTTPMQDYGLIEKEDVMYLRENASNPYSVLEFIQNKLIENHFVVECKIEEYSNNFFAKVQSLRPANEEEETLFKDETNKEVEELAQTLNEEELPIDVEELEDEPKEEIKKEKTKKSEPKEEEEDDDDDFLDDDDDELWGF